MRRELEILAHIDDFLDGKITKEELLESFGDVKNLNYEIESQQLIRGAIHKEAFIQQSHNALSKFKAIKTVKIYSLIILAIGMITIAVLLFGKQLFVDQTLDNDSFSANSKRSKAGTNSSTSSQNFEVNNFQKKNASPTSNVKILQAKDSLDSIIEKDDAIIITSKNEAPRTTKKLTKEIEHLKGSLIEAMNGTNIHSNRRFKVEIYSEEGEKLLRTFFNAGSSQSYPNDNQKDKTIRWFLFQNENLKKGTYTALFYSIQGVFSTKRFEVN
jgi:hypothetical protein